LAPKCRGGGLRSVVPERWRTQRLSNCRAGCWFGYHCRYLCLCHCRSHAADRRPYPPRPCLQKREPVLRSPKPIIVPYAKSHSPSADKIKFTVNSAIAVPMGKPASSRLRIYSFVFSRIDWARSFKMIQSWHWGYRKKTFSYSWPNCAKKLHMFILGITS